MWQCECNGNMWQQTLPALWQCGSVAMYTVWQFNAKLQLTSINQPNISCLIHYRSIIQPLWQQGNCGNMATKQLWQYGSKAIVAIWQWSVTHTMFQLHPLPPLPPASEVKTNTISMKQQYNHKKPEFLICTKRNISNIATYQPQPQLLTSVLSSKLLLDPQT